MSWLPVLNLGNSIKSGKTPCLNEGPTTVTFTPFADTNYVVMLTPYVTDSSNGPAQAWVSGSLTPGSFTFTTTGAAGVYWMVTYSNS
jgi:hypothetical protein